MRPVFIHGTGLACGLGQDVHESAARLVAGAAPVGICHGPDGQAWPYFPLADPAPDDAADWLHRARTVIVRVADEALQGSPRCGVLYLASTSFHIGAIERGAAWTEDGHCFAEQVAGWLDWEGPVLSVSTACTSALNAVLAARCAIGRGMTDEALVLGIELFNRYTVAGFSAMQLLTSTGPRPLHPQCDGLALGEAVAALRLSAAPAPWRLRGGASLVSGEDATGTSVAAIKRCWQSALACAETAPAELDVLKLQAAGSPMNDGLELQAAGSVFAGAPQLTTFKHCIGHTLGASGAAELVLSMACAEQQAWPVPPAAPLEPVGGKTAVQMASIIGFGGSHAAVIFSKDAEKSRTAGRCRDFTVHACDELPEDWRDRLARRLGGRPRRIGSWAELALFGALQCLEAAAVREFPPDAIIRLCTLQGPRAALTRTLRDIQTEGMAMPFGFLQSQAGQALAALSQYLGWSGDARLVTSRSSRDLVAQAVCEAEGDVLMGWVDEAWGEAPACSRWRLLRRVAVLPDGLHFEPAQADALPQDGYLRLTGEGLLQRAA